jgi:hypothetical protein
MGFNHLSVDWHACGHRPKGYSLPHYDFSFFRVTPEFRVQSMICELLVEDQIVVPGEKVCAFQQDTVEGMNFWIVPGALVNRNPVVNMPFKFERPDIGNGPLPYVGQRSWDQKKPPAFPNQWNDLVLFMSTYGGDLVMWQAHVPYKMLNGELDQFNSGSAQYFETTIQTLPDTYSFDYDAGDGKIRYEMIGKSNLCKTDFERAQAASGGAPIFPNYAAREAEGEGEGNGEGEGKDGKDGTDGSNGGDNNGNDNDNNNNNGNSAASARHTNSFLLLTTAFGLLYSLRR